MKVHLDHSNITQNMHRASRNYRYVLDVSILHGNISRKGYGNALIGRYGGCFEERYKEVYDDRVYHAKGLDAPAS